MHFIHSTRRARVNNAFCVLLMCAAAVSHAAANRPISVNPANPHYFLGMDGRPVLFLSHADNAVATEGLSDPQWHWYLDECGRNGLNLAKFIGFNVADRDDPAINQIQPYARVPDSGRTTFGHPKWDLDRWNEAYFALLRQVCSYAEKRGVYIQVQLWNHINIKPGHEPYRWDGCAFNPENTVTHTAAYGFPGNGGDGSRVFYASLENKALVGGKTLLQRQEELFDRVVKATRDYPNVFYELGLEVSPGTAWARHWVERLHRLAPGKPIIADITHYHGDHGFFDGYTRHQVSSDNDSIPKELYATGRMAIEDTDFIDDWAGNDLAKARAAAWLAVCSGVSFTDFRITENVFVLNGSRGIRWKRPEVVRQLANIRRLFQDQEIPFWNMAPNDSLATDGADVLAGDGRFVVYTRHGEFSFRLPAGSFYAEWYDPRHGSFTPFPTVAGGTRQFRPPTSEDWVLYLRSAAVQQ